MNTVKLATLTVKLATLTVKLATLTVKLATLTVTVTVFPDNAARAADHLPAECK